MKPSNFIACLLVISLGAFKEKDTSSDGDNVSGKIYFSNTPFGETSAGAKSVFLSNEFIYARMELQGGTLKEAFKISDPDADRPYPYLNSEIFIYKDGELTGSGGNYHIYLTAEDLQRIWFNLDVLPDPVKISTLYSRTHDFSTGYGFFPLYGFMDQQFLPENGNYKIVVKIYYESKNAWGNEEDREKWPELSGEFEFSLRDADIQTLIKNGDKSAENARENAFRYTSLPDEFKNGAVITDPKATNAKIAAILKRDLPQRTILKYVVEKWNGVLWHIAHDDWGIPKYRYFNPHVWVAYKLDGKCYVGTVTLRETYSGGGTYGPLQVGLTSNDGSAEDRGIDCGKIK